MSEANSGGEAEAWRSDVVAESYIAVESQEPSVMDVKEIRASFSCIKKSYFLTFKGSRPQHQRIDFVRRMCAKLSKSYFIVRESNKQNDGYHFHALVRLDKYPPKNWFKKGCHIKLQRLGSFEGERTEPEPQPDPVVPEDRPIERAEHYQLIEDHLKKQDDAVHAAKTTSYMVKELAEPKQFENYVLVIRGRNKTYKNTSPPGARQANPLRGSPNPAMSGSSAGIEGGGAQATKSRAVAEEPE